MSLREDFLNLLEIGEEDKFGELQLRRAVGEAYNFSEEIWQDVQLTNFPDHGINHSFRVLKVALDIAEKIIPMKEYKLSNLEKMILGIAVLIHDIGMQYQKKYHDVEDDKKVRESHCTLGNKIVIDAMSDRRRVINLPQLYTQGEYYKYFIEHARYTAFSHHTNSGDEIADKYWEKLKEPAYNADAREAGGVLRRLKLLAGLLHFGDELDMDQLRLQNISMLNSPSLDPENKTHWSCCYYTRNIEIRAGASGIGSLRIYLHWRAPKGKIEIIRILLQDIRQQHFNNEIPKILPYLVWKEGVEFPVIDDIKMDSDPEESEDVEGLPEEVEEFLRSKRPYESGEKLLRESKNLIELSGNDFEVAKQKADYHIRSGEGVIIAHYVLKTKWHTDKYIKCRELVADPVFTESLVKGLTNKFKDSNLNHVIAQGTSAIRIGSLLSIALDTKFSYASEKVKFQFEPPSSKKSSEYEKIVTVSKGDKILILDDIFGVGVVFSDSVSQLKSLGFSEKDFIFFCIYSLGHEKKDLEKFEGVKLYYLKAFQDVGYWEEIEKDKCEECKDGEIPRNFE